MASAIEKSLQLAKLFSYRYHRAQVLLNGKVKDHFCIDRIRLGLNTFILCKGPNSARIDPAHGHRILLHGVEEGSFVSARSFKNNEGVWHSADLIEKVGQAAGIVANRPALRFCLNLQRVFTNINRDQGVHGMSPSCSNELNGLPQALSTV